MSNAYTLLIIYARIDLTPWYIECLYCLLVVEEVTDQFKLKIGKINGDLLQPYGIRYEVWSFSVRHLISIAYWKGLICGVKLSVVVPQAIGISLRNTNAPGAPPIVEIGVHHLLAMTTEEVNIQTKRNPWGIHWENLSHSMFNHGVLKNTLNFCRYWSKLLLLKPPPNI